MLLHSSCPQSTRAARAPYVCSEGQGSAMRQKRSQQGVPCRMWPPVRAVEHCGRRFLA